MNIQQKIAPCLWLETQAEEAANFYTSIFSDAYIDYTAGSPWGCHCLARR